MKKENPRILLVSHEMTITGAPQSLLRQACYFRDAGHAVDVWTMRPGPLVQRFRDEGFDVTTVDGSNRVAACQDARGRYALIVCNTYVTHFFAEQFAKSEPVVWFIHEIGFLRRAQNGELKVHELLRTLPCVYTVSEYAQKALSAYNAGVLYFNNSVRDEFAGFDDIGPNIRFGYIGAINENKNIEGLIDAFVAAHRVFPEITLDICGNICGKDITKKMELIDRLMRKTQDLTSIHWRGEVTGAEKNAFFHSIDVLCVPSLSETSCLSLIEGAMWGKAIVSTTNVGANYMLDGGGGKIVPAGSTEDLETALASLAGAPLEVKAMQRAAREGYLKYGTEDKEREAVLKMLQDVPARTAAARQAAIRHRIAAPAGAVSLPVTGASDPDVKVSVVLPIYNMQRYLCACLDSVLRQTLRNIEVICVNDGSTDGTWRLLADYEAVDGRIRIIDQGNGGAGKARNTGLAAARGEYVCFFDPDDFASCDMLERMCRAADEESADIAICRFESFDHQTGKVLSVSSFTKGVTAVLRAGRHSVSPLEMADELFFMAGIAPWNKIFRRSFIKEKQIRFQELRRANDMFFVTTALANARSVALVDRPLYHYRKGIESATTNDTYAASFCAACEAVRARLKADGLYESFEGCFVLLALRSLLNNVLTCYDYRNLRELYPQMRRSILALIPEGWNYRSAFFRKAYGLLRETDDPLSILRLLLDHERSGRTSVGANVVSLRGHNNRLRREVLALKNSESYRVGLFITWPARFMYRLLGSWRKYRFGK